MKTFFEVKAKYDKENDKGQIKPTTELYVFEAVNHGDAEESATKELAEQISGEFSVKTVKQSNFAEIIDDYNGEYWFKTKVSFKDIDAKTGKEKSVNEIVLISADNSKQAIEIFEERLKTVLVPWRVVSTIETKILDVFFIQNKE